jgi:fucose permease
MAKRAEVSTVYAAGLIQGVVLVTFPGASTILTSPRHYDLSSTQYGTMFLPQVITAIVASLLGTRLAGRFTIKRVYLAGLVGDLLSMGLLITSQFFTANHSLAYGLLLAATAAMGVGFGLTVPALNTLTAAFHPDGIDRSVLVLNALLGVGTALAPAFVAVFVGLGFWWGLPVTSSFFLVALILQSSRLPLSTKVDGGSQPTSSRPAENGRNGSVSPRFILLASFALLYGICETINGNWSERLMTTHFDASTAEASLALTIFWVMVTVGRVLFAAIQRSFPTRRAYHLLPLVLSGAFVLVALLPKGSAGWGVLSFALTGLGCSALLPLTISFAQEQLVAISASVAGGMIAFYQVGYGIAAFGVGPLEHKGLSLSDIFGLSAVIAVVMTLLSFFVAGPHDELTRLHPRPARL